MVLKALGFFKRFSRAESDPKMRFGCKAHNLMHYSGWIRNGRNSYPERPYIPAPYTKLRLSLALREGIKPSPTLEPCDNVVGAEFIPVQS